MEFTRQKVRRPQVPQIAIHLQLPLYLCLTLGLLLGVMVIVAGATALTRLMQRPPGPFAAYDNLISGDTHDPAFGSNYETLSRAAFDLACTMAFTSRSCFYKPENGPFSEIRWMELNDEGEIGIYFATRDNALTVGDLSLMWGRPTITRHENSLILHWPDQHVSAVVRSDNGQFQYRLPVSYLLIGSPPEELVSS